MHHRLFTLIPAVTFALASIASAHEAYIEDTPEGKLVVRFAEYGDKFETSPGVLDTLVLPYAWRSSTNAKPPEAPKGTETAANREMRAIKEGQVDSIEIQKKSDHFLLVGADPKQPAFFQADFTVMGNGGDATKPNRKPIFYARWGEPGSGDAKPELNFDIVPTSKPGEARIFLRGKPTAGIKVTLYPPAEAEVELTSDETGLIKFTATKPGLYFIKGGRQRETFNGFFGGKQYDVLSHNTALTWRQK